MDFKSGRTVGEDPCGDFRSGRMAAEDGCRDFLVGRVNGSRRRTLMAAPNLHRVVLPLHGRVTQLQRDPDATCGAAMLPIGWSAAT